ncbi:MAG: thioredoxin, partial [Novosphingobium sp.]|uniref:thioredoxin n=1 Tax=Novosphingobium sp. TaxID=1874826 RepID=UPI0032B7728F
PAPSESTPSDTMPTGFGGPAADEPRADEAAAGSPDPEPEPESEPLPPPPVGYADIPPAEAPVEPAYDDDFDNGPSSFAHEPPFGARRNPARMWTLAAALFATVSLGVVGATAWWGLPDWMPFAHPLFAEAQPGLKLDFPAKQQDRHQLPDNTWYFGASGTVTNLSQVSRTVPPILIVLRDARGRVVYNAEVQAPKRVLAPGESVSINEALVQVPKAAVKAEFGWKPG